jgi:TP901 family phage tail tape measure protein
MADIETSIGINLDTSNALAAIKNLQREISAFHTTLARGSSTAAAASASLQKDLINNLNATGKFSASMTNIKSTTESFTAALEKNKFSMGEYFRYAGGASKTFGQKFTKEFNTIEKVARERVKDLQTQYIQLGRNANGSLEAIKIRPMVLDLKDAGTQMQIAAQKQQIFNQLLKQGSTNLLNFGKNTQWAGRQLMVGFTIPLSVFGNLAAKTFMDLEKQAIKFRRVYGELFTPPEETEAMIKSLQELALEFTKYGVAVESTMDLAASAAAMGETGTGLLAQVTEANRLAVLGNVDQQEALSTTISLTNAFGIASTDLANKINFLNAVENQTVTAIEDLTIAIPKAAPVIQQLGGNVEDLAFFLTAMKEGGINASEGANALKSGLASLINPTGRAAEMLSGFGINIKNIVESNKGDVKGLVIDFAKALDTLDPLNRAQAIEQLFGKFQFSRLSTLFQNVIAEGTQAERVLALSNATVSELAALSEKELGSVAESTTFRFQKSIEDLKMAIAPIGEQFLKAVTPILEFATKILNSFNSMNDGVKNFVVVGGAILAGLGPVFLMLFGLLANGVANIIKGFSAVRGLFQKTKESTTTLGEQMDYMTREQLEAAAVASSLERAHMQLQQRFTSERDAIEKLIETYKRAILAKNRFSTVPGVNSSAGMKLASGIVSVPGPKGAGDIVPAMLSPGEAVIPADKAEKYAPLINGMIAGNIPGYQYGKKADIAKGFRSEGQFYTNASHMAGLDPESLMSSVRAAGQVDQEFGDLEIRLVKLLPVLDQYGKQIEANGKKQLEAIETIKRVRDLTDEDVKDQTAFVRGQTFGGTTVLESASRNSGAYEASRRALARQGVDGARGASFTLQDVVSMGQGAELALEQAANSGQEMSTAFNKNAKRSEQVQAELETLVREAREASQALASSSSIDKQYAFSRDRAVTGIQQALLRDSKYSSDTERAAEAQRRVAAVDQEYARLRQGGLDEVDALTKAQSMLQAKMVSASTAVDGFITIVSGQGSASKFALRPTAAFGKAASRGYSVEGGPDAISAGRGPSAADLMTKRVKEIEALGHSTEIAMQMAFDEIMDAARRGLRISSPSGTFDELAMNVEAGVDQAGPEVKEAGKALGTVVAQSVNESAQKIYKVPGARRATTDQSVYLQAMSDQISGTIARGAQTQNRFISPNMPTTMASDLASQKLLLVAGNAEEASSKLNSFGAKAMNASFALSSVAAVSSMFGNDLGWLSDAIYGITTGLFALTGIVQVLSMLEAKRAAIAAKEGAKNLLDGIMSALSGTKVGQAVNMAGGLGALKTGKLSTNFSNLAVIAKTLWSNMSWVSQGLLKLAPIVGISVVAFGAIAQASRDSRARLDFMGKAAFVAGENLKSIANIIGFDPIRNPSDYGQGIQAPATGTNVSEQIGASDLANSDALNSLIAENGTYFQEFEGLKKASLEQAGQQMTSLMNQLIAISPEGTDISKIREFVIALANKAGKEGITLGIAVNPYADPQTFSQNMSEVISDLQGRTTELATDIAARQKQISPSGQPIKSGTVKAKQLEVQFGADTRQVFNETASAFEQLRTALGAGTIGIDEFNTRSEILTNNLKNIPALIAGPAMNELIAAYGIDGALVSGITNLTNKLALLQALQMGAVVDPAIIAAIDAADDPDATQAEKDAGAKALIELEKAKGVAITNTINAAKELEEQNIKTQAAVDLSAIESEIDANNEILELAPKLVTAGMEEADAYDALTDAKWRTIFASAKIKDLEEDPTGSTTTNIDAAVDAYKRWKGSIEAVDEANENVTSLKNFDDYIKDLEEDKKIKADLEANSELAADAQLILNNEMLKSAYVAAAANGELPEFIANLAKFKELEPTTTGGAAETTPFQDAIEQLKEQRKEIINTSSAFNKLRKAGIDVTKSFRIAKDPILAAALAAEKVGTKKWKELVALINRVNSEAAVAELKNLMNENVAESETTQQIAAIEKYLTKIGYTAEQVERVTSQIGNNPDILKKFADDIKDGKVNAKAIRDYLASVKNIKIGLTIEDMESKVNQAFSDISAGFAAKREQISIDFEMGTNVSGQNKINPLTGLPYNTTAIKKSIKEAEEYIAQRQYSIDDYDYQLVGIQEKEEKINDSYDKRIDALDKIQKLNEKNAQIGKDQLNVANALATGDIAAAAAAVQEARQNEASRALDTQKQNIEAAREAELAAVRSASGLSRVEIENKIKILKDEILKKEEEILEPQQRALDLANGYKDAADQAVTYLGKNEGEWKKVENGVRLAKVEAEAYKKAIEDAIALIPLLQAGYASATGGAGGGGGNNVDPNQARIDALNNKITANRTAVKTSKGTTANDKKLMAQNVKLIKELRDLTGDPNAGKVNKNWGGLIKKFSMGGFAMGSDTVPAMLTPGEFVVRKYAVKDFGLDRLKSINNGTYNGESVYNYELNVNMSGTDLNADDVARTVISKIKQIDSQRIRGNNF